MGFTSLVIACYSHIYIWHCSNTALSGQKSEDLQMNRNYATSGLAIKTVRQAWRDYFVAVQVRQYWLDTSRDIIIDEQYQRVDEIQDIGEIIEK